MSDEKPTIRPGSKTLEVVLKPDELYGQDALWLGPRGRDYGAMLPNPKPYQHANLYPDPNSSYWFSFLEMPEGSVLELRGNFPHCRYFQFALYRSDPEMGGYTATGEKFVDHQIQPDTGSENPFVPGTDRSVEKRAYTLASRTSTRLRTSPIVLRTPSTRASATRSRWSTGCTSPTKGTQAMRAPASRLHRVARGRVRTLGRRSPGAVQSSAPAGRCARHAGRAMASAV